MNRLSISLLALIAALPAPGLARDFELDEIVVSANREAVTKKRTGTTVLVVTEAELAKTAEISVSDYLKKLPGITINAKGGAGAQTGFTLRGASQNYVTVLVDGINVSDPSGTQVAYDFGHMTTAGISRIEVLKGSQSALYGSGAVAGVISITTRKAVEEGTHQTVEAEVGSFATRALTYGLTQKTGDLEVAITLSHLKTDGYSAAAESAGNTEADGHEANRLSFSIANTFDNGLKLGASGFLEAANGAYDEGYPLGDGVVADEFTDRETAGVRVYGEFSSGAVDHMVEVTQFKLARNYDETSFDPDYGTSITALGFTGTRLGLGYRGAVDLAGGRLVFGADYSKEGLGQTGSYGDLTASSNVAGIYAEFDTALSDRLELSASLRHDEQSSFGGFTTGRVALAYRANDSLTLRMQAGTGYRAPSPYELFAATYGNPDLKPETSKSLDFGVEQAFGDAGYLRATAFYLEATDLIGYDSDTYAYIQVPGISVRKGVEVEAEFVLSDRLEMGAAYTYTDSSQNASSAWAGMAQHLVALNLSYAVSDTLQAGVAVQHAGGRPTLPDYTVVNATMAYDLGQDREVYLRIENLFDEQYQLVPGYGTSERAIYVGLRASF